MVSISSTLRSWQAHGKTGLVVFTPVKAPWAGQKHHILTCAEGSSSWKAPSRWRRPAGKAHIQSWDCPGPKAIQDAHLGATEVSNVQLLGPSPLYENLCLCLCIYYLIIANTEEWGREKQVPLLWHLVCDTARKTEIFGNPCLHQGSPQGLLWLLTGHGPFPEPSSSLHPAASPSMLLAGSIWKIRCGVCTCT